MRQEVRNYPHHAAAVGRALGIDVTRDAGAVVAALEVAAASRDAILVEDSVVAAGGCAAALRSAKDWNEHPAGHAVSTTPLIAWREDLSTRAERPAAILSDRTRPAAGFRVLDLTRVIAGPVAGRTLAALAADVLRVDSPSLPELPVQHLDTGPGKRSALLDLADTERRELLLHGADVVLLGYRPGALERFGLEADQLAERHPHLIQVSLSAWGTSGPWAHRRGFDSLVQVASGIADTCATPEGIPGVLPAQALDHATGHLMAAAALHSLAQRTSGEPTRPAAVSLARTARELLSTPRPDQSTDSHTRKFDTERYRAIFGNIAPISPPGTVDNEPLRWTHGPRPLGSDKPTWS